MNIFADQCVRLAYDNGVVSFCLESAASQYAGVTVHMPAAAFEAMTAGFVAQVESLGAAPQEADAAGPVAPDPSPSEASGLEAAPLGPKFASVSVDAE